MTQSFFLNPTLIQEIILWRSNTGENLLVFEPIARAASSLGALLLPDDPQRAAKITEVLEAWCASLEFESLLDEARKSKASLSMELGRETLSQFSKSESFVVGVPIDDVLTGFSALIRADLRARESRSITRIDELFLWQAAIKRISLHDITLLILAAFASNNVMRTFDRLLSIKEDPSTLYQIDAALLSTDLSAQFMSGMRLFALSHFEAAETAYSLAIEKDPHSPSVYLAMSLLHIINGKYDAARRLINEAQQKSTDSSLLQTIKQLINILFEEEPSELWADDPIAVAVASFFMLRDKKYTQVRVVADKHLQEFPNDVIMQAFCIEAILIPVRDDLYNDPPLPATLLPELSKTLDELRIRISTLAEICETIELPSSKSRASINLSCLALMQRDFKAAGDFAKAALAHNATGGEAKINLATTMIATGDLPKAIQALSALPAEWKLKGLRLAAEAHYHACAFEPALEIWKRLLSEDDDRLWRLRTLCRMLEAYRLLRDAEHAQDCVDIMLTDYQHEPETLFALGYELWQMSRTDDAINALRRTKDLSASNLKNWVAWELGRVLFDVGKNLAATDEYVSIVADGLDSVQAREFTVALFRAGLLPAAFERAKAIREIHGEVVPGITEIETDFLVRDGKLKEAKDLLTALSLKRPLSVLNRMAVVRICAHLDQEEEALAELANIMKLQVSDEMHDEIERFRADLEMVRSIKIKHTT